MIEDFQGKYVNDADVSLPTMDDFYYNSLAPCVEINKATEDSFFYVEEPPCGADHIGLSEDGNILSLKTDSSAFYLDDTTVILGAVDGDTVEVDMAHCDCGSNTQAIALKNHIGSKESFSKYLKQYHYPEIQEENRTSLRFLFINAAEIPHYTIEVLKKDSVKKVKYSEVKNNKKYFCQSFKAEFDFSVSKYDPNKANYGVAYNDNDELSFNEKNGQVWFFSDYKDNKDYAYYFTLNQNDCDIKTVKDAFIARDIVVKSIKEAKDIRICVSTSLLYPTSLKYLDLYPLNYKNTAEMNSFASEWKKFLNDVLDDRWYVRAGYNIYGLELYQRALSVVYVKLNINGVDRWINLNKYVLALTPKSTPALQENHDGSATEQDMANFAPEAFKPWTYNYAQANWVDNFWRQSEYVWKQESRRKELQKQAFAQAGYTLGDDKYLYEWTVSIGDVTFFVPPTAITILTQTMTERLPVLRARGSMAKNIEKADSQLEISLYFNNESGINGQEIQTTLWSYPNNEDLQKQKESDLKVSYYMNGLRALIAEFRFTPFLPVVNKYINETLNIYAVSMEQLTVQTIPGFPKLLKAVLTLKKFDYGVFMPELPDADYDSDAGEVRNPFSNCINYDLLRYYYQKPLIKGNEIADKLNNQILVGGTEADRSYSPNSIEFMRDTTFSGKSTLMPMRFMNPSIDIYIANEDHLKRLLSIKKDVMRKMKSGAVDNFIPNSIQRHLANDLDQLWYKYNLKGIYEKYNNELINFKNNIETYFKDQSMGFKYTPTYLPDKTYSIAPGNNSDSSREELSDIIDTISEEAFFIPMYKEISSALMGAKNTDGEVIVAGVGKDDRIIQVNLKTDYVLAWDDIRDLVEESLISNNSFDKDEALGNTLHNKIIQIHLSDWKFNYNDFSNGNVNGVLESLSPAEYDIAFIRWCSETLDNYLDANTEASELKQAMDWEDVRSIEYDLVGENIRVDSFETTMKNNFARVSLLDSEGSASQYLGSQDISVTWKITTKDADFAGLMKGLPEYEAYCMRKYHLVLPCYPIKLDSEFTRMLGIFEVSIEDVMVSTLPNYPGVYEITVRAISTDRTLRNREALKALNNNSSSTADGDSGELGNEGITESSMRTQIKIRTYDELSLKLARAELYPDLELPTVDELGKLGFRFMRYKNKERDTTVLFVDPDFYFYYPQTIKSEIIKSVIQANFGGEEPLKDIKETRMTDITGAKVTVDLSSKEGKPTAYDENDKFKQQKQKLNTDQQREAQNISAQKTIDLAKQIPAAVVGDSGKWDISTKITCSYMERYFLSLLELNKQNYSVIEDTAKKDKLKELYSFYEDKLLATKPSAEGNKTAYDSLYNMLANNPARADAVNFRKYNSYYPGLYIDPLVMSDPLGLASDGEVSRSLDNMLDAVWAAFTGIYEYNDNLKDSEWKGRSNVYGNYKDVDGHFVCARNADVDVKKLLEVGCFRIRRLTYGQLIEFLEPGSKEYADFETYYKNLNDPDSEVRKKLREKKFEFNASAPLFVLDPYYRLRIEEVDDYLEQCCKDVNFCRNAFVRNVIWWLLKLYNNNIFPSVSLDIMRNSARNITSARLKAKELVEKELGTSVNIDEDLIKNIQEFVKNNSGAIDAGKFFTAIVMAMYNQPPKGNDIYNMIVARNYEGLNQKLKWVCSEKFKARSTVTNQDALLRKFVLALCGLKEINAPEYVNRADAVTPASNYISVRNTKIALEAATNPAVYLWHSFYDMIRHDYRGRMLRAFPTYYCVFLDEGREIGLWKLHDNFYSMNAINEINIVKSRKIPADTCTILLSNNYSTFTTDDEDGYINYKGATFGELWDSVFHKRRYATLAEKRRLAANKVNRAKLQAGIRIHVREGYGSDARELAGIFNGVITQVAPGAQAISIVAQGNGIELANPIMEDRDADEIQYKDYGDGIIFDREGAGASPKTILTSFLTTKGGALNRYVQGEYDKDQSFFKKGEKDEGGILNAVSNFMRECWEANPYGIYNFGDPDFKDVFPAGEIVQNIYEVSSVPHMDQEGVDLYNDVAQLEGSPYISFNPQGKTIWDIMHICKSVAPDYMTGIVDFGFRNSIFFGRPHYYYAYDYVKHNDAYVERRKPYQQYHIYFSDSDIIENNIKASASKMKTVATGLFQDKTILIDRNRDVGPMWVDKNIYPENQKSMLVDTRLALKSGDFWKTEKLSGDNGPIIWDQICNTVIGAAQGLANVAGVLPASLFSLFTEEFIPDIDDKNSYSNHKKIAWSATADALKESVKEMYQGSLIVLGDPSVKPNDRVFINDAYNNITGQVLVREVVHNLSINTGFTTTMTVDTIATVDDPEELKRQSIQGKILLQILAVGLSTLPLGVLYKKGSKNIDALWGKYGKELAEKSKDILTDKGKTLIKEIKENGKIAQYLNAVLNGKSTSKIVGGLKISANLAKLLFQPLRFIVTRIPVVAILTSMMTAVLGSINSFLLDTIKNHRVLQIYPLRKNGMVYTAGLDGNIGLVYGSPTFNQIGPMEKLFGYLLPDYGNDSAWGHAMVIFKEMFLSEEVINAAAKQSRDFSAYNEIGNGSEVPENKIESSVFGIIENPVYHKQDTAYGMSLFPRAIIRNKEPEEYRNVRNALSRTAVEKIEDILEQKTQSPYLLVSEYNGLKPYINNGKFFEILHDKIAVSSGNNIPYQKLTLNVGGREISVNAIKRKETNKSGQGYEVLDVPYLVGDALIILKEICALTYASIAKDNSLDFTANAETTNGTKIVLTSALRVNSQYAYCGQGHCFYIRGTGKLAGNALLKIAQKLYDDVKEKLNKNRKETEKEKLPGFEVSEDKNFNEVCVKIHPKTPLGD